MLKGAYFLRKCLQWNQSGNYRCIHLYHQYIYHDSSRGWNCIRRYLKQYTYKQWFVKPKSTKHWYFWGHDHLNKIWSHFKLRSHGKHLLPYEADTSSSPTGAIGNPVKIESSKGNLATRNLLYWRDFRGGYWKHSSNKNWKYCDRPSITVLCCN